MYSNNKNILGSTSTPKRRRLGTGRILLPSQVHVSRNKIISPRLPDRCDSPHLPCNQVEYLNDSVNNTSVSSDIPCSPGVAESSVLRDMSNWESLVISKTVLDECDKKQSETSKQYEDISILTNDMFSTHETSENHVLPTTCMKHFRENVEESFNVVNESICGTENVNHFYETKDSFLLNIRESSILKEQNTKSIHNALHRNNVQNEITNHFYGLPIKTRDLFKTYRNIEKFYDWQEECLNLNAIKERHNLIYALPTSGGKTLVAEVLMLREVINRKQNALFILPYVAIVQEKIWALSPFAVQLEFLVEEYAGGKGHLPPKKRRTKNSIYIATIEKGLALVRSLIPLNRLNEIGLIVVDELHLIGEAGRGGTLETLLSTVIFANQGIQIVGMSATIGNLEDIAGFLNAEVFQKNFRPVELTEYVKLGNMLHRIEWKDGEMDVVPEREVVCNEGKGSAARDPDGLGALVLEVAPREACLVFCPTKRSCENVARLLADLYTEALQHRQSERRALSVALAAEGAREPARLALAGVGYHHAGLAPEERALLEHAFRSGVVCAVCCTSTLAAGVNLPARRVVVRGARLGTAPLDLAAYRQMVGRAGRAGHVAAGESILVVGRSEWAGVRGVLRGGLPAARSRLRPALPALLLAALALGSARDRRGLRALAACTLLAREHRRDGSEEKIKESCDEALRSLLQSGAIEVAAGGPLEPDASKLKDCDCYVYNDTPLKVSALGRAATEGCMDFETAKSFMQDLDTASKSLVLMGSLHLLYIVSPHDAVGVKPDYRHYHTLYSNLDEEGLQTAKVLGITERIAVRMISGKPIKNPPEIVLRRFYVALMLRDLWNQMPVPVVAEKYGVERGTVQAALSGAGSLCARGARACAALDSRWAAHALLAALAERLQHAAAPHLHALMDLPNVRKARAMQLMRAGFKRVEDIAKASPEALMGSVSHLTRTAATHLVSAARMMLIEKVENLRAEAEDVMEDLKV